MPCGHSEAEFAQFTKTERRILRMIFELHYDREQIKAAMEIVDGTFRMHIAAIKRKQAVFRRMRAEEQIKVDQQRTNAKFLPEMESPDYPADVEKRKTIPFERATLSKIKIPRVAHNNQPLKDLVSSESADAPIPTKPSMPSRSSSSVFEPVSRGPGGQTPAAPLFRVQFSQR